MKKVSVLKLNATKMLGCGDFPSFIHLGHRHLLKAKVEGEEGDGSGVKEYILPLDLIRMTVSPALLLDIEEVRLGYKKV